MPRKVAFHTLGCKVNYCETEALRGSFRQAGFEAVPFPGHADVYVFNTCTVTHLADRKSRQAIRRARRNNPQALVAVIGCYAQVQPQEVRELKEVDIVLGTADRLELPALVSRALEGEQVSGEVRPAATHRGFEEMPWSSLQGRTRAFLKIQDGCDRFCSYCIVPLARGPLRSLPPGRVLHYLEEIRRAGYKEVVLSGVHLGLYGADLQPKLTLADLLEKSGDIAAPMRLRLSSLEPADITEHLVQVLKEDLRFCPHLHLPLQSGDDRVLEAMKRPYNLSQFSYLLQYLRANLQDLAVSTDLIVGFPGETESHFDNTMRFVQKCAFSRLHVFKYSPRRGTLAAAMKAQVSPGEKERRSRELIALGERLALDYQDRFLGRTVPVLLERCLHGAAASGQERSEKIWEGLTAQYLRVHVPAAGAGAGQLCQVRIESSRPGHLLGKRAGH